MITDPEIREQAYNYFIIEAQDLLQEIEQNLLSLREDFSIAKVHSIMRAAHTIKGGAANVELEVIKTVAHSLEDIFKGLYNPDLEMDGDLHRLLFDAYECLDQLVTTEITGSNYDEEEVLNRSAGIFAELQEKLGNVFGDQNHIPSSAELGFDLAQSIFEMGVGKRIETIANSLATEDPEQIAVTLRDEATVLVGLAESLNLIGFQAIATQTLAALDANPPERVPEIAEVALRDFRAGREAVLAGDRDRGGEPSQALLLLAAETQLNQLYSPSFVQELELFAQFQLEQGKVKPKILEYYHQIIDYICGWFYHRRYLAAEDLSLNLLMAAPSQENNLDYFQNWLEEFLLDLQTDTDSTSLCFYRQWCILDTLQAIGQYLNDLGELDVTSITNSIKQKISQVIKAYRQQPPISEKEKHWLLSPIIQHFLLAKRVNSTSEIVEISPEQEELLFNIWGKQDLVKTAELTILEDESQQINDREMPLSSVAQLESDVSQPENIEEIDGNLRENEVVSDRAKPSEQEIKKQPVNPRQRPNQGSPQYIRVNVADLERVNYLNGELLINQNRQNLQSERIRLATQQLLASLHQHQQALNELRNWSELSSTRQADIPTENAHFSDLTGITLSEQTGLGFAPLRLDQYKDFHLQLNKAVQETTNLKQASELIESLSKELEQTIDKQKRLLTNVTDDLLEVRMLPVDKLFNRLLATVEKQALAAGKDIKIQVTGTEVLIDKAIAERLYGPLLHLVRNAFDHGIESPGQRQEKGKPPKGLIKISAYNQGTQAIIEVKDDGRGLDFSKIRRRALDSGLLPQDPLAGGSGSVPTEAELAELIFHSGFSTVSQVSEFSGRGVGLDVVREQITTLKGSISLSSIPDRGTTFTLQIPFSMTTAKLMLVKTGGTTYALLLETIDKIVLPTLGQVQEIEGNKTLHWQIDDEPMMVSVRQLSDLIRYQRIPPFSQTNELQVSAPLILVRSQQGLTALAVDEIIGEQELVIRPVGSTITAPEYVCGCTILGDSQLILVIDSPVLLNSSQIGTSTNPIFGFAGSYKILPQLESRDRDQNLLNAAPEKPKDPDRATLKRQNRVLVVDDAINIRKTLTMILEKCGYQVFQAEDGVEALEKLRQIADIDVVVCDLEMPRMNGFEVLSNIFADPNLAQIPVVILTSRDSDKHRRLAEELGATAYFTKPCPEKEFLELLDQIIRSK